MNNTLQRYLSLDVLRGLTVTLMIIVNTPGNEATTYWPLLHAAWHGFTPTDLVFPTFLFVVGNAMSFTLDRYASLGTAAVLGKVFQRTALIFLLGFLLYWFPFTGPIADTRIPGVLQRIALCYGIASLVLYFWKERGAVVFSVVALLGYWALLASFGDYTLAGNAVLKLDRLLLGERHLYHGEGIAFDPEGLLSTLPAIANVIAGYFAGRYLRRMARSVESMAELIMIGAVCIVIGLCWNFVFPINKKLWTSSYSVFTIGLDLWILSILVYVIDMRGKAGWTYFFEVFGRNTLFIYLLSEIGVVLLFDFHAQGKTLYAWIYSTFFQPAAGDYNGSLLFALGWMLICWGVGFVLDRRKIYIRV
jgi:predicted acyltransferase